MKLTILTLLFVLSSALSFAEGEGVPCQGRVVSAETGEALPFVSIYVREGVGTMTNEEGEFSIVVNDDDVLQVSCMGYEKLHVKASSIDEPLRLKPMSHTLQEVTVFPARSILEKTAAKLRKSYRKNKKERSVYFYRQLTKTSADDLVETFTEANSAVNLREIEFVSGRHGRQVGDTLLHSLIENMNFHHLLELSPAIYDTKFWNGTYTPLGIFDMLYIPKNIYSYSAEILDDNDRKIYAITASRNLEKSFTKLLTGTLYIDAKTYELLGFKGQLEGFNINIKKDLVSRTADIDCSVVINYRSNKGFPEVQSIGYNFDSGDLKVKAILFNIDKIAQTGELVTKKERRQLRKKHNKKNDVQENMLANINGKNFAELMKKNANFVKRTAAEAEMAEAKAITREEMLATDYSVRDGNNVRKWHLQLPDNKLGNMTNRLVKIGQIIPQEKVFVHMDNTCYFLGDTLWFSAYLRRTNDDKPSDVSGILYVELLNQDGYVVKRNMVEMANGRGHGNFVIDKDWYSGFYELRAYTRWQLNWGAFERKHSVDSQDWFFNEELEHKFFTDYDKLYSRVFPVYDAPIQAGSYNKKITPRAMARSFKKDPDKNELQLRLYPEGGEMIKGVPCRVAFEAAYTSGEYVDGTISIQEGKKTRRLAHTDNRGRGVFTFTPTDSKSPEFLFTATDKNKKGTAKASIKNISADGVVLSVEQSDSLWNICVTKAGELKSDTLGITIMHDARVRAMYELTDSVTRIALNNDDLETGVNQATVFDAQGRKLADRLFFVTRPDMNKANISISGVKDIYKPYEKVDIEVQSDKSIKTGVVSLAIRDNQYSDVLFDNGDMFTEMLLASEIKGFVPNPSWYFEKDDYEHRHALDLLMMTQGWRRFNWRQMAVRGEWELTQPDEHTPIITGTLYDYHFSNFYNISRWCDKLYEISEMYQTDSLNNAFQVDYTQLVSNQDFMQNQSFKEEMFNFNVRPRYLGFEYDEFDDFGRVEKTKSFMVYASLVDVATNKNSDMLASTKNGRFTIRLPKTYSPMVLFLTASDSTKWMDGKRKNMWVNGMPDAEWQYKESDDAESTLIVHFPYPRFAKPFDFYQQRLNIFTGNFTDDSKLSDGSILLSEVKVNARHSSLRQIPYSMPAFQVDGYEGYNHAIDAGMRHATPWHILRSYMGDYGQALPYVNNGGSNKDYRMYVRKGAGRIERMIHNKDVPMDSIYRRAYLDSRGFHTSERIEERLDKIDRYVIYSDYQPRLSGSARYAGSNLPESVNVAYPLLDDDKQLYYRDRRYVFNGIDVPDEFYSPDYSKRELPKEPTDYRRTLYWNPALQLNANGTANVTFWNNSNASKISVYAEGLTNEGILLHGEKQ